MTISWEAVEGATEYHIYETAGNYKREFKTTQLSYEVIGWSGDFTYCSYIVKAYDGNNFSLPSNEVKIPTSGNAVLTTPVLTVDGTTLSWSKVNYAKAYEILRRKENESDFTIYVGLESLRGSNSTTYTLKRDYSTDYYYAVVAADGLDWNDRDKYYATNFSDKSNVVKIEKSALSAPVIRKSDSFYYLFEWDDVEGDNIEYCIYKSRTEDELKKLSEADYFETVSDTDFGANIIKKTYYAVRTFWKSSDGNGDTAYSDLSNIVEIKSEGEEYGERYEYDTPVLKVNGTTLSWTGGSGGTYIYKGKSEDDFIGRELSDYDKYISYSTDQTFEGELNYYYAVKKSNRSLLSNIVQITTTEKEEKKDTYSMENLAGVWQGTIGGFSYIAILNADGTGYDNDGDRSSATAPITWKLSGNTVTITELDGTSIVGTVTSTTTMSATYSYHWIGTINGTLTKASDSTD